MNKAKIIGFSLILWGGYAAAEDGANKPEEIHTTPSVQTPGGDLAPARKKTLDQKVQLKEDDSLYQALYGITLCARKNRMLSAWDSIYTSLSEKQFRITANVTVRVSCSHRPEDHLDKNSPLQEVCYIDAPPALTESTDRIAGVCSEQIQAFVKAASPYSGEGGLDVTKPYDFQMKLGFGNWQGGKNPEPLIENISYKNQMRTTLR